MTAPEPYERLVVAARRPVSITGLKRGDPDPIGRIESAAALGRGGKCVEGGFSPRPRAVTWNKTIATAGADFANANTGTLATVGPFTITGYRYLFSGDAGQYIA